MYTLHTIYFYKILISYILRHTKRSIRCVGGAESNQKICVEKRPHIHICRTDSTRAYWDIQCVAFYVFEAQNQIKGHEKFNIFHSPTSAGETLRAYWYMQCVPFYVWEVENQTKDFIKKKRLHIHICRRDSTRAYWDIQCVAFYV